MARLDERASATDKKNKLSRDALAKFSPRGEESGSTVISEFSVRTPGSITVSQTPSKRTNMQRVQALSLTQPKTETQKVSHLNEASPKPNPETHTFQAFFTELIAKDRETYELLLTLQKFLVMKGLETRLLSCLKQCFYQGKKSLSSCPFAQVAEHLK